ncbi:hypothetical protein [uncultured Olsenella sp.]|uniref:AfsR/SARP family transcriptional regulator n=1 Tax=uncultured Olsenella sp. TaxID=190764 RepID=UPI0026DD0E34|nr:hypothetical protein [uncultured Olsenella sp.]
MGKTRLLKSILSIETRAGSCVKYSLFVPEDASSAPGRIVRIAREVVASRRAGKRVAVLLEGVPPGDESDVGRELRAIRKMLGAGALVAMTISPDSAVLFESLDDAIRFTGQDLCIRDFSEFPDEDQALHLSHGVPSLCAALVSGGLLEGRFSSVRYLDALKRLIISHLRSSLSDEDLMLRLAMILLGRGSFDDLGELGLRPDGETLLWMHECAPALGIDFVADGFSVVGADDQEIFPGLASVLGEYGAIASELCKSCAELLARRGEYVRSAMLARLCVDEDALALAASYGVGYILSGRLAECEGLQNAGTPIGQDLCMPAVVTRQAMLELSGTTSEYARGRLAMGYARTELAQGYGPATRYVSLLGNVRDVLSGRVSRPLCAKSADDDEWSHLLRLHATVLGLCAGGKLTSAFALLLDEPRRRSPKDLPSALACLDFSFLRCLMGEAATAEEEGELVVAREVIERCSPKRLSIYRKALESSASILMGRRESIEGLELAIARAGEYGDLLVEAALLVSGAVGDLGADSCSRAHVRATRAIELADAANSKYLASAARLVLLAARIAMGEKPPVQRKIVDLTPLDQLGVMLVKASHGERVRVGSMRGLSSKSFPRELLWALGLVATRCGPASAALRLSLPDSWSRALEAIPTPPVCMDERCGGDNLEGEIALDAAGFYRPPARRASVTLLGGLNVSVDGIAVPISRLGRRHAGELLCLLAMARGHRLRKHEALEAIWGDRDYVRGMQKLYECVSTLRSILGGRHDGMDPLVSNRTNGSLELNEELVSVDIDELRAELDGVFEQEGSDRFLLAHAARARRLYGGGAVVGAVPDVTGAYGRQARKLRRTYSDAMVSAASAALREGRPYMSSLFARSAIQEGGRSEDATEALVKALAMMGRFEEIREMWDEYARSGRRGGAAAEAASTFDRIFREALESRGDDETEGDRQPDK